MEKFTTQECKITGGFAGRKQDINASVSMYSVYKCFSDSGRFKALKCEKQERPTHIYWDSDVAKWIEACAYVLARKDDEQLRAWYEEAVCDLVKNQRKDGYFNSYFQVYAPNEIFGERNCHELYCAGHLFEAAVSCSRNLKDDRLLKFASKYVDYIIERFVVKKDTAFTTPGHEEIEIALYKLYKLTGEEKYKMLAEFFIDSRGRCENDHLSYIFARELQSHLPVRQQYTAEGHAVRAVYLYSAMADLAKENDDEELKIAVTRIFEDIVNGKMFLTGGVGSSHIGEKFTTKYDLTNYNSYSETCATIGLTFFADRMFKLTGEAKYLDVLERGLFNGVMSGVSLSGDKFFYVNPLEMQLERKNLHFSFEDRREPTPISERLKIFSTSCCPPNICRYMEELPELVWYKDQSKNTLVLSQFMESQLKSDFVDATIKTDYPHDGKIKLQINSHGKDLRLQIRKPAWCNVSFENEKDGFIEYNGVFNGQTIEIDFCPELKPIYPNGKIFDNSGKVAFSYGPLILCAEGVDNATEIPYIRINTDYVKDAIVTRDDTVGLKIKMPALAVKSDNKLYSYEKPKITSAQVVLIPYYAWANRGDNDMRVWLPEI